MLLDRSGGTKFVECTLRDPWEDLDHRVCPLFLVHVRELDDFRAVSQEGSSEERVQEENVANDISKVENFAEEVTKRVGVVHVQGVQQILHQSALSFASVVCDVGDGSSDAVGDHSHLALLPVLPDPVRDVETEALEEQHEGHPLVVGVDPLLLFIVIAQAGVHHAAAGPVGQRERVRDPAVRVEHVSRHGAVVDARYGVPDEVVGGDEDAAEEQDGGGDAVVHAEHHVVDHRLVDEVADLHEARHRRHQTEHRHLDVFLDHFLNLTVLFERLRFSKLNVHRFSFYHNITNISL